jgi:hypothetical protein
MLLDILVAAFPVALLALAVVAEGFRRRRDVRRREVVPPRPSSAIPGDKSKGVRLKARGVRVTLSE